MEHGIDERIVDEVPRLGDVEEQRGRRGKEGTMTEKAQSLEGVTKSTNNDGLLQCRLQRWYLVALN